MPSGQQSLVIVVDYASVTLRTNPSIAVARKVLTILQQHYVETLGRALVVNLPYILNFFYKGISPFLDPVTRDKVCQDKTNNRVVTNYSYRRCASIRIFSSSYLLSSSMHNLEARMNSSLILRRTGNRSMSDFFFFYPEQFDDE
jgi:hypothetical protein